MSENKTIADAKQHILNQICDCDIDTCWMPDLAQAYLNLAQAYLNLVNAELYELSVKGYPSQAAQAEQPEEKC